jgi:hypothetical protein
MGNELPFGITVFKIAPNVNHTDPFMKEVYRDVSKPEERKAWLPQFSGEMFQYTPGAIHLLDEEFSQAIMDTDSVTLLMGIMDEIRSCERLHPKLKENLLLNIRNKL